MIKRDIVVVGASAGGLDALTVLISALPADFPAAVLVVWHVAPESTNYAAQLLNRKGALPVLPASNDAEIEPGHVYVAVPDRHLLLTPNRMRVAYGPKENRFRPAIDALFRSAAYAYGPRVIGVILTGMLDDGTAGLWTIKDRGGLAMVQDPADAAYPSMPETAAQYVKLDAQLPVSQMAAKLVEWTSQAVPGQHPKSRRSEPPLETLIASNADALDEGLLEAGEPTLFVCPECEGVLLKLKGGGIPRFRCHTGHAYSIYSLLAEVNLMVEQKLWSAAQAVEESGLLMQHLADHLADEAYQPLADTLQYRAVVAENSVKVIRGLLADRQPLIDPKDALAEAGGSRRPRRKVAPAKKRAKTKPARRASK